MFINFGIFKIFSLIFKCSNNKNVNLAFDRVKVFVLIHEQIGKELRSLFLNKQLKFEVFP